MLGATSFTVLADYADRLADGAGRLYLTGVDPALRDQMRRSGSFGVEGPTRIYAAEPALGESTLRALEDAEAWLVESRR
jgi:SulP family sulfate permease